METIIEKHFKFNYKTLVKRVKYRTGNNEADAEDVVMEAYARALKYKDSFEMGSPFNLWISRIISNALKDWKREQYNHSVTEEFDEEDADLLLDKPVKDDMLAIVLMEIATIPEEEHREVLNLNFVYGFSQKEISQITNIKTKTVNQILFRFKDRLKVKHA